MPGGKGDASLLDSKLVRFLTKPDKVQAGREAIKSAVVHKGVKPTTGNGDLSLRWGQRKRSRVTKPPSAALTETDANPASVAKRAPGAEDSLRRTAALEPEADKETAPQVCDKDSVPEACNRNVAGVHGLQLGHLFTKRDTKSRYKRNVASSEVFNLENDLCNHSNNNGHNHRRTEIESLQDMLSVRASDISVPKILISLSHKEKEEDFLAFKGSKLPQRPRRRAKHVERSVSYVTPGVWLGELPKDRYVVKEKKLLKKKPKGLKEMNGFDSDSE